MVACPVPPAVCYVSCQPMPCYMQVMPCPPAPQPPPCSPPQQHRAPCPPPQHYQPPPCPPPQRQYQPPPCPPPPCCGPSPAPARPRRPDCICYPAPPAAGLPSNRSPTQSKCPTCGHGSAKEAYGRIERKERPANYGSPGALSDPGAGCQGPPCLGRRECPAPCQPQFPPMLPCCTGKCPSGPCPAPGTSLMVGMSPPDPKCQPCDGKPPGCSPASEFPFNNPGPCEPCLWPPLCLRS